MNGSLHDALDDLAAEARPVDLAPRVARGVRRRRQRRLAAVSGLATLVVAATVLVVTRPDAPRGGLVARPTPRPVVAPDAYDVVWFEVQLDGVTRVRGRRVDGSVHDLAEVERFVPGKGDLSPDGRRVALVRTDGVEVLELHTGQRNELRLPVDEFVRAGTVSWAPDSRTLAIAYGDSRVRGGVFTPNSFGIDVVDTTTGARHSVTMGHANQHITWSPDGTMVALSTENHDTPGRWGYVVLTVDGEVVRRNDSAGWVGSNHAWSPDGRRLIVGDANAGMRVVDIVTGAVEATLRPVEEYVWRDDAHVACHCRHRWPMLDVAPGAGDPQPDEVIEKDLDDQQTRVLARIEPKDEPDVVEVLMRAAS